jgi:anti-sigma factor (TIGR02949 family)
MRMEGESCHELLGSLSEYVDGSLSSDLCAAIEKHMQGCNKCRVVVDTLKKTVDLYHVCSEDEALPDGVRERLYKRLNLEDFMK